MKMSVKFHLKLHDGTFFCSFYLPFPDPNVAKYSKQCMNLPCVFYKIYLYKVIFIVTPAYGMQWNMHTKPWNPRIILSKECSMENLALDQIKWLVPF